MPGAPAGLAGVAVVRGPLAGAEHGRDVGHGRRSLDSQTGRAGRFTTAAKISLELGLVQRLPLEQGQHQGVEHAAVLHQDLPGLVVGGLDQPPHLLVDDPGDLLGVVALVAVVPAEEDLAARSGRA